MIPVVMTRKTATITSIYDELNEESKDSLGMFPRIVAVKQRSVESKANLVMGFLK